MAKPKVSIITITYNHEKYIREALDSFVMQEVDFEFEVLVADDASTDKTQAIISEYAKRYPELIKPLLRKNNMGAWTNFLDVFKQAKGQYVALCEGDDFWTDPNKLQKQVDFLDAHPNHALCFHPVRVFFENNEEEQSTFPMQKSGFTTEKLLQENYIQTNSVMYRRREDYSNLAIDIMPGDWYLHLYHAQFGKIGFINSTMSAYRRHSSGIWWGSQFSSLAFWKKHAQSHLDFFEEIRKLYALAGKRYEQAIDDREARLLGDDINILKLSSESSNGNKFARTLVSKNPLVTIKLLERVQKKINSLVIDNMNLGKEISSLRNDVAHRDMIISQHQEAIQNILNSKSYKIGHGATMPYRASKKIIPKRHKESSALVRSYYFDSVHNDESKIAVIVHLYYPDLWLDIADKLKNIKQPFDLYISTTDNSVSINKVSEFHKETNVVVFPNRGRDVLPFLMILTHIRSLYQYESILKVHTKKSKHRSDGRNWFDDILDELLPRNTQEITKVLKKSDTGLIGPAGQIVSLSRYMGDNQDSLYALLGRMFGKKNASAIISSQDFNPFFGGTMFWARVDYFDDLLKLGLKPGDFAEEKGQVDGTIAHAIERILGKAMHRLAGRRMYQVDAKGSVSELVEKAYIDSYKYV